MRLALRCLILFLDGTGRTSFLSPAPAVHTFLRCTSLGRCMSNRRLVCFRIIHLRCSETCPSRIDSDHSHSSHLFLGRSLHTCRSCFLVSACTSRRRRNHLHLGLNMDPLALSCNARHRFLLAPTRLDSMDSCHTRQCCSYFRV